MPVYEYQCNACDYEFEVLQSINARQEDTSCPQCQQVNVHRRMSAFASLVKGDQKPGFNEMRARNMYNERMDKFRKLPPIMGARAMPDAPNMVPHSDAGSESH